MPEITPIDIALAATNEPALSDDTFELGGVTYGVVYLKYKAQIKFLALLQPLMETVAGKMAGVDMGLAVTGLVKYCSDSLPELAAIVCQQTDPEMTAAKIIEMEDVTPFKLASIIVKQIKRNQMIQDVVSFFKQVLPLLKMTKLGSK